MTLARNADVEAFLLFAKPVPRKQFIDAMSQAVTGVTIIPYAGRAYSRPQGGLSP